MNRKINEPIHIDPLYPSTNYKKFVEYHKRKGLKRKYWKDLPRMWKEELQFRQEIDDTLNQGN
jgi:hypothetical protein